MTTVEDILEHHGVKGQKWGVRKDSSGGKSGPVSADVAVVRAATERIKSAGGTHVLENKELQAVVTRMNLEQNYSRLVASHTATIDKGHSFVKKALAIGATANAALAFAKSPFGQSIHAALKASAISRAPVSAFLG